MKPFNKLSPKLQNTIKFKYFHKLKVIMETPERANFFNKLVSSRNFEEMSAQEIFYTLVQIINMSYDTAIADFDDELKWLKPSKDHVYTSYTPTTEFIRRNV